ncbi:MAG TPA: class I SAM-dependent methyltransferase [Gemmataceae bacterium]
MLANLLAHPLTRGMDIDSPETTHLRKRIIGAKPFLRRIYQEWYAAIAASVPPDRGGVLELGSGAGFLEDYIPGLITSDVFPVPGVEHVVDAHDLPFADASLRGVVMTNVLHHLRDPRQFLREAARCVRPGGAMVMVEPWVSFWSRLIYSRLHHEPFEPETPEWSIPETGPLSGANGALPWILFQRDRAQFEQEFPEWQVRDVTPFMPFRYLLSGGVSMRTLMPACMFAFWRGVEGLLGRWMGTWAMFARVVLVRTSAAHSG